MAFDNAKLMSRSLLHQQHLKCASFVYSATEMEGANKESWKNQMWNTYQGVESLWKKECQKNEKKRQVSEEIKQWHKGVRAGQAASESMDKQSTSLVQKVHFLNFALGLGQMMMKKCYQWVKSHVP